ncbi:MAG: hypothetical protein BGO82_07500 [Devosia sp. 67-54]|mgnify:CR=1 FL=1|uniref:DUF6364 family protein n=1 Tax=unclassified Devosia TaxID=196773 RepID=UPI0009610843|nr:MULTISPECIES: DUF6364 family protein [unclassified Devosia]MBN9307161.1 hypothetical protein [Devosia sp.]OJX19562.1 MAG: hypothetical protein BGO82_07500 [Devosia sp. 67-54]
MTKNITLAVDEDVLDKVRVVAAEKKTTVNALVRNYLAGLATADNRAERARQRLLELIDRSQAEMGPVTWTKDELHEL